ncbi:MAG: carbonic anhydrase [Bacteroides sp.]|nr:carbonic anhydrase [Bacteroides sp.]
MNIKHIIRSQKLRHRIMRLGKFLPDSIMISLQYRIILGRWPNLKNPKRFTEWIQWYKIHYRDSKMIMCVDKFEVRKYLKHKGCEKYLNILYQICKTANEIDFDSLPQKFVIKTTSGGGGDNVLIIQDKKSIDYAKTIEKVNSWLKKNYSNTSREWAYSGAASNPKIIVEQYLENQLDITNTNCKISHKYSIIPELTDYKFFCFQGNPIVCQLISGRYTDEHIDYYDLEWKRLDGVVGLNKNAKNSLNPHPKPANFEEMINLAKRLSEDFPFARVDLYNINGNIYFGELTFYPGSGYGSFKPDSYDFELGKYFFINDEKWIKYIQVGK